MSIVVFGGTVEGRTLAEWLDERAADAVVCTATEYGTELVSGLAHVRTRTGRLDVAGMHALFDRKHAACVVDATHPYAAQVTENVRAAAEAAGVPVLRLVREGEPDGPWTGAADAGEAARIVANIPGNVLLTCGSKELPTFSDVLPDMAERVWVRVLPTQAALAAAEAAGVPPARIIAQQGPFSYALNRATIDDLGIRVVVTKASGRAGGFWEKVRAARDAGARVVVIHRPNGPDEQGLSVEQVERALVERGLVDAPEDEGEAADDAPAAPTVAETGAAAPAPHAAAATRARGPESGTVEPHGGVPADALAGSDALAAQAAPARCRVYLIGAGMGAPDLLVPRAHAALAASDLVIGAERMLALAPAGARTRSLVRTDDIVEALRAERPAVASVLFSGDVGFFSGAALLRERLEDDPAFQLVSIPGISSFVYFCDELGLAYRDVFPASAHGRACNVEGIVRTHRRSFFLTGGADPAQDLCRRLCDAGLGCVRVAAGERLSYPEERIVRGTAAELSRQEFDTTTVLLVENDAPVERPFAAPALEDEDFEHDAAPLTKRDIRALVISRLHLRPADTVWDVGAGSGSVSVEAALSAPAGRVFAIERDHDACCSIARNAVRHGATNVTVVEGAAPEALADLPAPDRVFVGGSAGRLREIVERALAANPRARIVVTAITLETVAAVLDVFPRDAFEVDIEEVAVSRARTAGPYHLMKAENPVYIATAERRGEGEVGA
ncbi:MAG: precorrin-6A reductase [Eggerthellaceae bacterium]|jgi:precorrin-6Y C5,15-methyltransferase (decarboxylating)